MSSKDYGKLAVGIIAAWFVFALSASAAHIFNQNAAAPPIALGLAVLIPIMAFWIWFRTSAGFREFVLSLDPRALTIVQSWRIAGSPLSFCMCTGFCPEFSRTLPDGATLRLGLPRPGWR
jgi:hypothetical protein